MKILSIEFVNNWSWGLIFNEMKKLSNNQIERVFMNDGDTISENGKDVVLSQNVTLLKRFKERLKTVCRLGGNYNFDKASNLQPLLNEMSKCYALIATNKKLFKIASEVNPNTYLIPNGLSLDEWRPAKNSIQREVFTVGFCGNISSEQYRHYKGYDFVKEACENLGLELKTALYKDKQIPHDRMMEDFYCKIDCLVHPTLGEGCSNTLMEACACGVPIITTCEAGFHGEMMEDGVNVLFCERTARSIQDKILKIKRNTELKEKLSRKARVFAEAHHDVKKIAKQYEEIFEKCHEFNQQKEA